MSVRIDLGNGADGTSVRVAGWLDEPAARELLDLCSRRTGVLIVDLSELVSADQFATQALRNLLSAGARIVGASPYIAMRLNGGPEEPATTTQHWREKEEE